MSVFDPLRTFAFGETLAEMDRQHSKPTRLTLLFYAAFAASYVQGRYTSPDFYRWVVGESFQIGLVLLILAAFLILTLGALIKSLRARRFPWAHAAAAVGAVMAAELIWRYGANSSPGLGFKDIAIVVDGAKPVVLALGLAAILSEWKFQLRQTPSECDTATV